MAKVKTEEKNLEDIAQAIVNKTHKAGCFLPSEMAAAIDNIVTLKEGTADGNATANEILNSKTAYVKGKKVVGEMPDQTGVSKVIKPSESFTIPKGYHDGTGEVTVDSSGSAAADSILSGKTAWVNGEQITGEMPNQGAQIKEINPNQPYTIPQGYHNGEGMVTVNAPGSATSNNVLSGKTAWVGKTQITGTMPNNSATNVTLHLINPSVSIPAGYNPAGNVNIILEEKTATPSEKEQTIRPSSGKVLSKVIVNPIPSKYQDVSGVTAVAGDVLTGKKYVNSAGQVVDGAMSNRGAETATITPDQTHAISKGYHNGNGEISVSTPATATAEDIFNGATAWINNTKVTGTMLNAEEKQYCGKWPNASGSPIDITYMDNNNIKALTGRITISSEKAPTKASMQLNADNSVRGHKNGEDIAIYSIGGGGVAAPQDCYSMFEKSTAVSLDLNSLDTSSVTDMSKMFYGSKAEKLDLSSFDTSNVTNMSFMFYLSQATSLDLSSFDTSNVTKTGNMFYWSKAKTVYCRTEADKQKFKNSPGCPTTINFIVGKPTT